jgi:hypothetical protein
MKRQGHAGQTAATEGAASAAGLCLASSKGERGSAAGVQQQEENVGVGGKGGAICSNAPFSPEMHRGFNTSVLSLLRQLGAIRHFCCFTA